MKKKYRARLHRIKHTLAHDLLKTFRKLGEFKTAVGASAVNATETAQNKLSDSISNLKNKSEKYMHKKPMKSLGMALLTGVFLGLYLRR